MRLLATWGVAACVAALPAAAADTWTTPFTGGRLLHRVTSTQDLWVLKVDLCQPGVSVRATRESERQQRTSSFASSIPDAVAAVNGDFFSFATYQPSGPARSGASTFGGADNSTHAPLAFGDGDVTLKNDSNGDGLEEWMEQVVSGHPTILHNFAVDALASYTMCQERHPRTAAGLSEDRQTLFLTVVDGRRSTAIGMKCPEVAQLLKDLGAWRAVNLDGGGSSTLWTKGGGVRNRPSDGSERVVGNHLVVKKTSALRGRHCPLPVLAAELDGYSPSFSPPTLTLDEGQSLFGRVRVKNTGALSWTAGSVRLAPTPRDTASPLRDDGWISATRVVGLEADTAPGEMGRFAFEIRGNTPGTFVQTFGLVASGAWFSDDGGPADDVIQLHVEVLPAAPPVEDPPAEPDAGPPVVVEEDDAGPTSEDAGATSEDAGATSEDAGPTGEDAGPTGEDAGATGEGEGEEEAPLPASVEEGGCSAAGAALSEASLLALLLLARRRRATGCGPSSRSPLP